MQNSTLNTAPSRDELFERIRRVVYEYLRRRHSESEAEDMTQRAFVIVLERYAHLDREADLVPLTIRCAQFVQLEEMRKKRRCDQPPEGEWKVASNELSPEERLLRQSYLDRLNLAIPQLKERCRHILRQRLLGVDTRQIAKSLEATPATLHVWESRCRANLQQILGVVAA